MTPRALDITDDESVQDLADSLDGKPIDVLILNSGVYPREGQKIGQIDYEGWRKAFETDVLGTMRVIEALLGECGGQREETDCGDQHQHGVVARCAGRIGGAGRSSYQYRSSKTALNMALSILAKELAPRESAW